MPEEYYLEKKTIGGWSRVTWYDSIQQAEENYARLIKDIGYSYRLVKVETVKEDMLDEVVEVEAPELEPIAKPLKKAEDVKYSGWNTTNPPQNKNSWGGATSVALGWNAPMSNDPKPSALILDDTHGGIGKVWMLKHDIKQRARVNPNEVNYYLSQGWIKGGPKTAFN